MAQTTLWQVGEGSSGLTMREAVNDQVAALVSNSSGSIAPSPTVAGQWWFDTSTTPGVMKQRNVTNDGWIPQITSESPTFTGVPLAPTPTAGTNTTQIASTAFVSNEITVRAMPKAVGSGVGTFQAIYGATNLVLPAGGKWTYWAIRVSSTGAAVDSSSGVNVTGGSTVAGPAAGQFFHGFAWKTE